MLYHIFIVYSQKECKHHSVNKMKHPKQVYSSLWRESTICIECILVQQTHTTKKKTLHIGICIFMHMWVVWFWVVCQEQMFVGEQQSPYQLMVVAITFQEWYERKKIDKQSTRWKKLCTYICVCVCVPLCRWVEFHMDMLISYIY